MTATFETWMFLTGFLVQALGIASMAAARWARAGKQARLWQRLFFGSLCGVGALALAGLGVNGQWLSSGMIFSVMVVGAVLDLEGRVKGEE